jgi:hypothetical protein
MSVASLTFTSVKGLFTTRLMTQLSLGRFRFLKELFPPTEDFIAARYRSHRKPLGFPNSAASKSDLWKRQTCRFVPESL